jgi:uncharacterized protein
MVKLEAQRTFGRTGVRVPLVGYGTAPLGRDRISRDHAVNCLNHAIDRGITYLDTSPGYGSEPHLGEVMRTRREEVFLATKIDKRSLAGVREELEQSLERLQTDHLDLVQVHAVSAWADLEQALAPDGAIAALEKARAEGLIRFIGITGHSRPSLLARALNEYEFDSVLVALSIIDHLITGADLVILPVAREHNTAVIAMKVLHHGLAPNMERALRYALGLEGVSLAIVGMDKVEQIDRAVELAARFQPLSESEYEQHVQEVKPLIQKDGEDGQSDSDLFWLHDTSVTGWQQGDEPRRVSY